MSTPYIIVWLVGLVGGTCIGSLLVFTDSKSEIRRQSLFKHIPQLPYFILLYAVLSGLSIILKYPYEVTFLISGMIGVESSMYFLGKRLQKSLDS